MSASESPLDIRNIRPYFEIDDEALQGIGRLLASGQVTNNGRVVQNFERLVAAYLGIKEAVAVSTGADALLLALKAFGLPKGKVILPAYTYVATLNAVIHAGLDPVFCDIDPGSFTMDPAHLKQLTGIHTDVRCVLPVNVFGIPAELPVIREVCDRIGAKLLYDNAHGFGTEVRGCRVPSEPDAQIFSFHATKALPAVEGGLIVSAQPAILSLVRQMRNHGLAQTPAQAVPGFNAKLDEIRALIGTWSLKHFPDALSRRRRYGQRLVAAFQRYKSIYVTQIEPETVATNFQNVGVRCLPAERVGLTKVKEMFAARGIEVRSYFDPPLYKFNGHENAPLPVTEATWRTLLSFPIYGRMKEPVLERIEEAILEIGNELQSSI
jgi:dTDP-4-amino-4,6-dideoxygalactose transaminase